MFTRLTTFPLKPNSQDKAHAIATKYETVLHDQPGHLSTVMILDGDRFRAQELGGSGSHALRLASRRVLRAGFSGGDLAS